MKKIPQGSIIRIPLLKGLGYAYAKYVDLSILRKEILFPDIIKVFKFRTVTATDDVELITSSRYLLEPIAVAGLLPTIKAGIWEIVGCTSLSIDELIIPDFKSGNSTLEEIDNGEWYIHRSGVLNKTLSNYKEVIYLQPFAAMSSSNIELRLTMYHVINEGMQIDSFFDRKEDRISWHYRQVLDSPALPG